MYDCSFCNHPLTHAFLDLGHHPPSNAFLSKEQLAEPEIYYPLKAYVCDKCFLVQIPEYTKASDIFNDSYPYYSSQSPSNVAHAKIYVDMMSERFNPKRVLEIGSNDGYLLQHFQKEVEVCGIEMAKGPVEVARKKGIPGIVGSFGTFIASGMEPYDLICNINTLAHQPKINDFVKGMKMALAPNGVITCEFPHLMKTIECCQFDQFYFEHFSYFSFATVCEIFARHGLAVFDVDEIPEHGGSLRIYAKHAPSSEFMKNVPRLLMKEQARGMFSLRYYEQFQGRVDRIKHRLVRFLLICAKNGKKVCAYGAAAKGNTLLNYCGIRPDLLPYVVDRSPHKIGKFLPGSHIPVTDEAYLKKTHPDYVLILPWNLKAEIMEQLKYTRAWGSKFIIPVPQVEIL